MQQEFSLDYHSLSKISYPAASSGAPGCILRARPPATLLEEI
jgi:hypothetical protein